MKKILPSLFILCFLVTTTFAQRSGGLKGGLNLSSQKWEVKISGGSGSEKLEGVGFHVGGYLNYALSDVMSLQPELLFNVLKVSQDGTDLTLNYISVPVMFGYGVEANKLIFQAGPQLGVLVSTDPSEMKDDSYVGSIDLSFDLGVQVNFGKFNISGRYGIGLLNIVEDKFNEELSAELGMPVELSIKNNNLQFSVGYKLFE